MLQGLDLPNIHLGVLLSFCKGSVAIMGYIESMFHQVHVPLADKGVLRFFRWKDDDITLEPEIYKMYIYSVASPLCVKLHRIITAHLMMETANKNFYVDDKHSEFSEQAAKDLTGLSHRGE